MSATTSIEWTDRTWNPTTGCDRVSPGCDRCYALTMAKRLKAMGSPRYQNDGNPRTSGPGFALTLHEDSIDEPRKWRKPSLVFVNSMSDLFHWDVPFEFIERVFTVMAETPQHTYQILTKRSLRLTQFADKLSWPPNVCMGVSVESSTYTFRVKHLLDIPAVLRFVSIEPMLGPIELDLAGIDWVIVGAESGRGARPMDLSWARDIRDQCAEAGVPLFVKQLSGSGGHAIKDIDQFPEDLRIRQWPTGPAR